MALNVLPTFMHSIDHASMKNSILPRVQALCLQTQNSSGWLARENSFVVSVFLPSLSSLVLIVYPPPHPPLLSSSNQLPCLHRQAAAGA